MINVGFIGCGAMGRDHVRRITDKCGNAQVVGVYDTVLGNAKRVRQSEEGREGRGAGCFRPAAVCADGIPRCSGPGTCRPCVRCRRSSGSHCTAGPDRTGRPDCV